MGKERRSTAEIEQQKKDKQQTTLIIVCFALIAILMIGVITYNKVADSGYFLRREVAAESANFEVDGAMMTYFFYSNYQQVASMAQYLGIDTTKSLKTQSSSFTQGTWFDYFMNNTKTYVGEVLALCEAAKANNVSLDAEDEKSIDASMDDLKATAKSYGYSVSQYLVTMLGANIKEKDVRNCMELTVLASKYAAQYTDSLSYTLEECETYYGENKDAFDAVDILSYTISRADFVETDEDGNAVSDMDAAQASAKEYADKLAAAASEDEFKAVVKDYIVTVLGEEADHADEHVAGILSEEVMKTDSKITNVADWAFSASVGDTTVYTADETVFDVFYLVSEASRDNTATRDVRHILFATESYASADEAKAAAEAAYAEWEAAGFTEAKFLELCEAKSNDTGSNTNGGLYEKVAPGEMVTEFDAWTFDGARVAGDYGLIESSYGWHIMSYVGENADYLAWQKQAESSLTNEAYKAYVEENSASNVFYDEALYAINA